jgi:hypothetical protein
MAWDDDLTTILRVLVADTNSVTYTDDTLEQTLVVAAFQVLQQLDFAQTYTVSIANVTIVPDPTVSPTKDDAFSNLVCLKAACITDRGAAITAANRAIAVRDGSSSIDLRTILEGKLKLLKQGWCAVYEEARTEYLTTQGGEAGAAIMTPFRTIARGGYGNLPYSPGPIGYYDF